MSEARIPYEEHLRIVNERVEKRANEVFEEEREYADHLRDLMCEEARKAGALQFEAESWRLKAEYWQERFLASQRELAEARELAESLKPEAMELDGLRDERDMASRRVAELEGILYLIIRERNQERYDDGPVFEPVREVS